MTVSRTPATCEASLLGRIACHTHHILGFPYGSACEYVDAQTEWSSQGSQGDCLACHRFCGELTRYVQSFCREPRKQQDDVRRNIQSNPTLDDHNRPRYNGSRGEHEFRLSTCLSLDHDDRTYAYRYARVYLSLACDILLAEVGGFKP